VPLVTRILEDEYGVRPQDIKWFTGGLEEAGRKERSRLTVNAETSVTPIASDKTLS
jgi:4,5-dihydroxyphthalate decarboxylase